MTEGTRYYSSPEDLAELLLGGVEERLQHEHPGRADRFLQVVELGELLAGFRL